MSVWIYMPSGERAEKDRYYCDDCIERGCSCNCIMVNGFITDEQNQDDQGRLLPCIEYDFNEEGFEKDE